MDSPADPRQLERSLDHLAAVNGWLGGVRGVRLALQRVLPRGRSASILDAGTGSADIPLSLERWAARRGRRLRITAMDLHAQTVAIAHRRTRASASIHTLRADVRRLPFGNDSFDVALLSLTLHHLDDAGQVTALRELARVARCAIVVNELERSWLNWLGARLLAATLWRRNPLTRHDGPISVQRAFTARELSDIATAAGLARPRVTRRYLFRLVLVADASAGERQRGR